MRKSFREDEYTEENWVDLDDLSARSDEGEYYESDDCEAADVYEEEYYEGETYASGDCEAADDYEEEYYEGETYASSDYEAADVYEEEYYEEEAYEPMNYEGDAYEEDACGEEYYEGETYESEYYEAADAYEDGFYGDEPYETAPCENAGHGAGRNRRPSRPGMFAWFSDMAVMDRAMLVAGVCVLCLAVAAGVFFLRSSRTAGWVSELSAVGARLEGIEVIGDEGLLAVADATVAKQEALRILEQEQNRQQEEEKNYHETDYNKSVTVTLKTVSVQKDLKIKFVNKSSDKLISNVPFTVTITTPDNKTETWADDDMDGIIYKKGIAPGNYKVAINALSDEKYAGYTIPAEAKTVEVKKDIAYKKIDVSDEVKTEAQVNLATEEQKKQTPVVESTLTDTVEWVESTAVPNTYIEVNKGNITDPMTVAAVKRGSFMRMSNVADNPSGETASGGEPGAEPGGQPSAEPGAQPGAEPSGQPGAEPSSEPGAEPPAAGSVSMNVPSVALVVGGSGTAQIVPSDFAAGKGLIYGVYSENTDVAQVSVDAAGIVTVAGVGVGETAMVATANYQDNPVQQAPVVRILITVAAPTAIGLDKTEVTVHASLSTSVNVLQNNMVNATITATSSDAETVSVSVSGQTVTITGLRAGTATVTVSAADGVNTVSASCAVTVKPHPKDDNSTPLKDNDGNQLYVQENNEYREAVYADYYKDGMKFFRKGEVRYTGWQTLNGKVYFFDASGNKVTGEQVIQGAKYNFASDGSLVTGTGVMGIDVSRHNGSIDWNAVKNSGVSYVIIRCGYRGYTQGSLIIDSKFEQNIKGATAAGLKVGVYFFSQAVDEVEAVEEASFVLEAVRGYQISYPIFLDVEYSGASGNKGRADGLGVSARTSVCKAFCETIKSGGYTAGIYANKTWLETKIDPGQLGAFKIWLAQYAADPTYTGRYDMWQYKSTGKVSGISGNVDMNLSYLGY